MSREAKGSLLKEYLSYRQSIDDEEKKFRESLSQTPPPTDATVRAKFLAYFTLIESRLARVIEIAKTFMKIEERNTSELEKLETSLRGMSEELRASFAYGIPSSLQMYRMSKFMILRNQILDKIDYQLAYGHLVSGYGNPFLNLMAVADFLDVDLNWAYSAIALQLQEVAIKKISDRMDMKLNRANIERILGEPITLRSIQFMPFNHQYKAFSKVIKEKKGIDMPKLVQDMRSTRKNVLHLAYKPTSEETTAIITFTQGLLEKLKSIDPTSKS